MTTKIGCNWTSWLTLIALVAIIYAEDLKVVNNCHGRLLIKSSGAHSGQFLLNSREQRSFSINRQSSARVWAHAGCDGNGHNCDTTEGYVSLAEMFWDANGMTWYDVSQVDGYTLPITMTPFNANVGGNCHVGQCSFNLEGDCPNGDKIRKNGRTVGCRNPNRDTPNTDYARAMKRVCPKVYSWSKDDQDGMRACNPGNNGLTITFC